MKFSAFDSSAPSVAARKPCDVRSAPLDRGAMLKRARLVARRDRLKYQLAAMRFADAGAAEYEVAELLTIFAIRCVDFDTFATLVRVSKVFLMLAKEAICNMPLLKRPMYGGLPSAGFAARTLSYFGRCHVCAADHPKHMRVWNLCTGTFRRIGVCAECKKSCVVHARSVENTVCREKVYLCAIKGTIGSNVKNFDGRIGDPSLSVRINHWGKYAKSFIWTDQRLAWPGLISMNMLDAMHPALEDLRFRDIVHTATAAGIYRDVVKRINAALLERGLASSPYPACVLECNRLFGNERGKRARWHSNPLLSSLQPYLDGNPIHPVAEVGDPTQVFVEKCALVQKYPICGDLLLSTTSVLVGEAPLVDNITKALENSELTFRLLSVASWESTKGTFLRVWQFAIHVSPVSSIRIAVPERHVEELCGCKLHEACIYEKRYTLSPQKATKLAHEWDIGTWPLSERIMQGARQTGFVCKCNHNSFFHKPPSLNGRVCLLFCCSSCVRGNAMHSQRDPLTQIQQSDRETKRSAFVA